MEAVHSNIPSFITTTSSCRLRIMTQWASMLTVVPLSTRFSMRPMAGVPRCRTSSMARTIWNRINFTSSTQRTKTLGVSAAPPATMNSHLWISLPLQVARTIKVWLISKWCHYVPLLTMLWVTSASQNATCWQHLRTWTIIIPLRVSYLNRSLRPRWANAM